MSKIRLFRKVKCHGYLVKVRDGVKIELYDANGEPSTEKHAEKAIATRFDSDTKEREKISDLSDFCGNSVEKVYYKKVDGEFSGFIVGFRTLTITGVLGTDTGDEGRYCFRKPGERMKVGIVYVRNNAKRYVPAEDLEAIDLRKLRQKKK